MINDLKVYIASSWKNQHGVAMLTYLLRQRNAVVISWIENNYGEKSIHPTKRLPFEDWMKTQSARESFEFDTDGATKCDIFIYYAPSGKDACAELGAAFGACVPMIIGLYSPGEDLGLMRKMCGQWFETHEQLLNYLDAINLII